MRSKTLLLACILGIVSSFTTNLYAQNNIEDYKRDFSRNIYNLDPIEGIYEVLIDIKFTSDVGNISNTQNHIYVIKSINGVLRFFSLEKKDPGSGVIQKTANGGYVFIDDNDKMGRQTIQFQNKFDFYRVVDAYINGGKDGRLFMKWHFVKLYPTAAMYVEVERKRQEESRKQEEEISRPTDWSGTGFALNSGYVVTNYHVVEDAKSINVCGISGDYNTSLNASVVATDKVNDLAIIKINDSKFKGFGVLPYRVNMQMAEVGDDIYVLGYPLTQTMGDEIKLTNGIISSRSGFQGDVSLYQMSAPIQPGNSGGPMFDDKGNVIGVVCAQHRGTENVGYAIKTSYLKNLVESASLPNTIFPTSNTVSTLPLSGQVKRLKNYVYLIRCSSSANNSDFATNHTNVSVTGSTIIVNNPTVRHASHSSGTTMIKTVMLGKDFTSVEIIFKNNNYQWCNIDKNTYLLVNGKQYEMTGANGIKIAPEKTYINYNGQEITFTLYFLPIPTSATSIDLIEPGDSNWKFYGIKIK